MWNFVVIPTAIALLSFQLGECANPCQLSWGTNLLPNWYPLIWNNSAIVYPKYNGTGWLIEMPPKTSVQFGCGEALNLVKNVLLPETTLTCNGYGKLKIGLVTPNFTEMGCLNQVKERVVHLPTATCYNGYDNIDITFSSSLNSFPLINLCHNDAKSETIFAQHTIHGAALNSYEVSNRRPSFKEGGYFLTFTADDAYSQKSQVAVVTGLVGASRGPAYIDAARSFYFARGHLAPDGDFVHIYEQNATYYFVNVIPQWQIINNGNWKAMEMAIRDYATEKQTDLKIWTGGLGTLTLKHENGTDVEIYLAKDSLGNSRLPVPMISWKVVHNPTSNTSAAIFMVNNPHLTEVPQSLIKCPDICSQLPWVTWATSTIQKGYTYCCDVDYVQSHGVLPMLPNLGLGLGLLI